MAAFMLQLQIWVIATETDSMSHSLECSLSKLWAQNILLCVLSNRQAQECVAWAVSFWDSWASFCLTISSSLGLALHGDGTICFSQPGQGSSYDVRCRKWSLVGRLGVSKQSHTLISFHVQPGWSSCRVPKGHKNQPGHREIFYQVPL